MKSVFCFSDGSLGVQEVNMPKAPATYQTKAPGASRASVFHLGGVVQNGGGSPIYVCKGWTLNTAVYRETLEKWTVDQIEGAVSKRQLKTLRKLMSSASDWTWGGEIAVNAALQMAEDGSHVMVWTTIQAPRRTMEKKKAS